MTIQPTLKFSLRNKKLMALGKRIDKRVVSFDLLAGLTCPQANICHAWVNANGKISRGKHANVLCFAAKVEAVYTNSYKAHKYNTAMVQTLLVRGGYRLLANVLIDQITSKHYQVVRIHSSGDFYSDSYYQAWVTVANVLPDVMFFGYTKTEHVLDTNRPDNFKLVYSQGGKLDEFIPESTPRCYIVKSSEHAKDLNVPIACLLDKTDDYELILNQVSFAIKEH